MEITIDTTVADVIRANSSIEKIFKKYEVDICTHIDSTLNEIMDQNFAPAPQKERFLKEIMNASNKEENPTKDLENLELDLLIEHIEQQHHKYIEEKIPVINQYLERICKVHGENHPELNEIRLLFDTASGELAMHLKKEELILFPYIKKMLSATRSNRSIPKPKFESIKVPIDKMHSEHSDEMEAFEQIQKLSQHYTVPNDGCGTYAIAFSMLNEFQEDLLVHIQKENENLFKRAILLEKKLTASGLLV